MILSRGLKNHDAFPTRAFLISPVCASTPRATESPWHSRVQPAQAGLVPGFCFRSLFRVLAPSARSEGGKKSPKQENGDEYRAKPKKSQAKLFSIYRKVLRRVKVKCCATISRRWGSFIAIARATFC